FAYSSSANFHNSSFNEKWAKQKASEVIGEHFFLAPASRIYKLGKTRIKKIR
ncbi:MAG: threonylcarbamoyl-AMP synthase TsaC, partial [Candidatus Campylobacter infans]